MFLYASEELRKINKIYRQKVVCPKSNQNHTTTLQTYWCILIRCSAEVPGSNGCHVPQLKVSQCSHPFTIQHDLPPKKCNENFPSEPLRVTPSVCACLSANASSFLKLGPPVGLQTLLTAHSYASFLPNSTSTGTREEPEVSLHYIFWCFEISEEGS